MPSDPPPEVRREQQLLDEWPNSEWPALLVCVPCEDYVPADPAARETACEHSWDEATDIDHLSTEEWTKFRHDVYLKELERDEPRNQQIAVDEFQSLVYALNSGDALPDDYFDREGLDRLLVMEDDR